MHSQQNKNSWVNNEYYDDDKHFYHATSMRSDQMRFTSSILLLVITHVTQVFMVANETKAFGKSASLLGATYISG